jgi:hypothetical protein
MWEFMQQQTIPAPTTEEDEISAGVFLWLLFVLVNM